jgi:hypothetical protein
LLITILRNTAIGELLISSINKDNKVIIPAYYSNFADIASNKYYKEILEHSKHNLQIELEEGKQPLYYLIYNFLVSKLDIL